MIFNPNLSSEYGSLNIQVSATSLPDAFKPAPKSTDYQSAYIDRTIAIRRNDSSECREIDPSLSGNVNTSLYEVVSLHWKISGSRDRIVVNGIIEDFGVRDSNLAEIQKVNPLISRVLPDPLEFWRGY